MKNTIDDNERMNESAAIYRLTPASEFFDPTISEAKVYEEINYIAQTIHYFLGGFQTEMTYQNAFEQELIKREDQFSYFREFSMDIIYRGSKVGFAIPDFILIPNREFFNLRNELPAIFVEIKQKNKIDKDVFTDIERDVYEKTEINKTGSRTARQQLWKYLNAASYSSNPSVKQIDVGILINFSTELETSVGPATVLRDEMGAYLEVWQMITDPKKQFFKDNEEGENEMHLILDTFTEPMTRKEIRNFHREAEKEAEEAYRKEFES
tara:strand:+ start:229 stop:1029 length:801 start_codon:yes stop_codon:yes gene_type:complete